MDFESAVGPYDNLDDILKKVSLNFAKGTKIPTISRYAELEYMIPFDVAQCALVNIASKERRKPK